MRKTLTRVVLSLLAIGALGMVPLLGMAAEDGSNCVTQGTPTPAHTGTGAVNQNLAPVDQSGWVYGVQTSQAGGRAGAKGSHGWIQASGDLLTQKGRIEGRSSDVPLSGWVAVDGANSKVCVSVAGVKQKPLG